MSLFPAYSTENDEISSSSSGLALSTAKNDGHSTRLSASSYDLTLVSDKHCTYEISSDGSSEEQKKHKTSKKSKRKKQKRDQHENIKRKRKLEKEIIAKAEEIAKLTKLENDLFTIDRHPSRNNKLIPTLMRNDSPRYNKPRKCFIRTSNKLTKKTKEVRYYNCRKMYDSDLTVRIKTQTNSAPDVIAIGNADIDSIGKECEIRISKTNESFNKKLATDPRNEKLWLEYIDFQNEVEEFEMQYKKSKNASKLTNEKKLGIVEKALIHNPTSDELLKIKLDILSEIETLDKFSEELNTILQKDSGNIQLWIRNIHITQRSVSRFTFPKVISLYEEAMDNVNKLRKHGVLTTELNLIELFMHCGTFLRQTGMWEQLCMVIRLNLQLNLSTQDAETYKVSVNVPEDEVQKLEDRILTCGLPIHTLWLRLEKLRQRVHWYPVSNENCDDPQRIVIPTDVLNLFKPITSSTLILRQVFVTLFLLKVPPLPITDTVVRSMNLPNMPWYLDSGEIMLSALISVGIPRGRFDKFEKLVISSLNDIVTHPQYINDDIGQTEYLYFIRKLFKTISCNLPLDLETMVLVWWLRFERSLHIAQSQSDVSKKNLKAIVKELLKEERHRNNLPLFIEYALLEKDIYSNTKSCLKILDTAILMNPLDLDKRNSLTQLYRMAVEINLSIGDKERCMKLLISLPTLLPENDVKINGDSIKIALAEYQRVTNSISIIDYTHEFELNELRSQFFIEWVICQSWLKYLSESVWSAVAFIEIILQKFPKRGKHSSITVEQYYRELLSEHLAIILHYYSANNKNGYDMLNKHLFSAIEEFPNNILLLSTLGELELKMNSGNPWWKISKFFKSNDSHIAKLVHLLLCHNKSMALKNAYKKSMELAGLECSVEYMATHDNILISTYHWLIKNEQTKQCPLFWMMYLKSCAKYSSEEKFREIFSLAIGECPWVKELYMESANVLPDQVSQIQDLMIEKEIRIHITNDEIDILRDS